MSLIGDIVGKIFSPNQAMAAGSGVLAPPPEDSPAKAAAATPVDVNSVLTQMAASHREKLNWQTSIVDLLKVLNLDSSLAARQQLAKELHYTGDTNDSGTMNLWLHKEVVKRVTEDGAAAATTLRH